MPGQPVTCLPWPGSPSSAGSAHGQRNSLPEDVHVLNPGTCDHVTFPSKGELKLLKK